MKGSLEDYAYAAAGALAGALKYYRPSPAALAWGAIVAYEVVAPPGELLSEGADKAIARHPNLTRAAIGITALHLANALPPRFDPLHQGLRFLKGL